MNLTSSVPHPAFSGVQVTLESIWHADSNPVTSQDKALADLKQLEALVLHGSHDDKELAMDMLTQLACRTDETGRCAQGALRDLYELPVSLAPNLQDHEKSTVREEVRAAALRMCEILDKGPVWRKDVHGLDIKPVHGPDKTAPSITLAYLAGMSEAHPGGPVASGNLNEQIKRTLQERNAPVPQGSKFLDKSRCTEETELLSAAAKFDHLGVSQSVLTMSMGAHAAVKEGFQDGAFVRPLQELQTNLPPKGCQAAWINTGDTGYAHWMPLIVTKDAQGDCHYHVVDSNSSAQSSARVKEEMDKLFKAAGINAKHVHHHAADMQTHAPNGCGPLGHRLLRALNDELAKGQVDFNDPGSMSDFIEEHQGVWMSSMPADQDAAMRAERASLLENWSDKPIAAPKKEVSIHAAGGPHPVARDAAANAANADAANAADAASAKASAGHEAPVTHQEISLQSQLAALQAKLAVNTAAMDAVDKRMDENDALRDKLEESRDKLQVARAKFGKLQSRSDRIEANVKVVAAKRATMVTQFAIFQGGVRDWVARLTGKRS